MKYLYKNVLTACFFILKMIQDVYYFFNAGNPDINITIKKK